MRKSLVVTASIALFCALAASAAMPGPPAVPEEPRAAGAALPAAAPEVCPQPASQTPAGDGAEPLFLAPIPPPDWPCPFGAPRCGKDDDCDAYCGDPQFGLCSEFSGCCSCTG